MSFGVGCFHIGANEEAFDGSAANHVQRVRDRLEGIPSIRNVEIMDAEAGWFETSLPYGLQRGGQPFPAVRRLRVDFRLELTPEEQNEYYPWRHASEPFVMDISIRQGPAVPVAFVIPRSLRETPSVAVTLAWHALANLIPEDDGPLRFDMRARSPAPVDAFLVPLVEPDQVRHRGFEYERVNLGLGRPYATFAYHPDSFADIEAATSALFDQLERPTGLYYEITGAQHRLDDLWAPLDLLLSEVVGVEGRRGLRGSLGRRFGAARRLRTLAVGVTELEAEIAAAETRIAEDLRVLEELTDPPFLREEMDEALRTGFRFPTQRISGALNLFETRRLATAQNVAAVAAAILAAVIGATSALWVAAVTEDSNPTTVTTTVVSTRARPPTAPPPPPPPVPPRRSRTAEDS